MLLGNFSAGCGLRCYEFFDNIYSHDMKLNRSKNRRLELV